MGYRKYFERRKKGRLIALFSKLLAFSLCSLLAVWELHSSPLELANPTFSFIQASFTLAGKFTKALSMTESTVAEGLTDKEKLGIWGSRRK